MTDTWMLTIAQEEEIEVKSKMFDFTVTRKITKRELNIMLDKNDCKKWIIAQEVGKNGLRHYQCRLVSSNDDFFDWCKTHIAIAHLEKAETDKFDYERKDGRFWTDRDTVEIRKTRFGTPTEQQKTYLKWLRIQSVREIDVWYDPKGQKGKSWLANHLYETGKAHYVPPYLTTVQAIIQTAASLYIKEWRPIIIIDLPRSMKWSEELYVAVEAIKDGLIMDPRYSANTVNIRGVKVLVMTNNKVVPKKLSVDRWRINGSKFAESLS